MYRNNVVWELRASKTDELITTFNNKSLEDFEFSKQPEEIQKRIKKIVLSISDFNGFDENDFDEWYYYTVQDIAGYEDSMVILASYKTFEEAERYCKKHNISVNNILPQNFGEDFLDITEM